MKTIYQSMIYTLLACLLLVGCKDEKEEIISPSINLSGSTSHTFEAQGGSATVSFTSAKAWTVQSGQSWCKVSPGSGEAGTCTIEIQVDENTTYDERNTSVTIQSETVSKSITVTQKQKDALTVTSNKVEVEDDGGTAVIEVKANVAYETIIGSDAQSWISIGSSRGLATSQVQLQVKRNEDKDKREGKVTIKSGDLSEVVTIYQAGASPTILLSQNEYVVGSGEETLVIQLRSNVDYRMVLPTDANWLQVVDSRAFSDYTHYFSVAANDTYGMRSAEIQFVNEADGLQETVKVVQVQNDAIVVAQDEYTLEAVTIQLLFDIQANVEFEVATSVDWIQYNPSSRALETSSLSFVVEENVTTESREGVIAISSGDLKQEIKVIQQGRVDFSQVLITHTQWDLLVPEVSGRYLEGVVSWGDGQKEKYQTHLRHQYAEEKQYVLQMDLWGAEEVLIPTIEGIVEIDFSNF